MRNIAIYLSVAIGISLSQTSFAQPANDDCTSPINITDLDGTCNSYSNVGATFDTYIGGCMGDNNNVWFTFTPQGTDADITVSGINRPEIAVVAPMNGACNITDNVQVGCTAPAGNYSSITLSLSDLTIGYTYYILMTNNTGGGGGAGTYDICVDNPATATPTEICSNATAFCTGTPQTFAASTNAGNAQLGPDYDCLINSPNPAWFYLEISTAGNIEITMTTSPAEDIDYILYGPVSSTSTSCIDELYGSKVADCSFSAATSEVANITGASVGETYVLLITNFSNNATDISFSQTAGTGATDCSIVLPVEMLSFDATASGSDVNVRWTTATELNSDYFQVERSSDNAETFETIGVVQAAGESSVVNHYSFPDEELDPGRYYYRLTQVDNDGSEDKTDIRLVEIAHENNTVLIVPNPNDGNFNVKLPAEHHGTFNIEVLNVSGQVISSKSVRIEKGQPIDLDMDGLSPGVYFTRISGSGYTPMITRFIVQ